MSFAKLSPKIAKQWHPTKNGDLTPEDFANKSHKKVWWQCPITKDHEWKAAICERTRTDGKASNCPYCSGRKFTAERSFAKLSPKIAKQWHPTKNGDLTPEDFANKSRKKVWWQCPISKDHEWKAAIGERTRTDGKASNCPYCSGHKFTAERSFAKLSPEIAKQWHPTKNGDLTPEDFANKSNKKVWWQCSLYKEHEWESTIANRTGGNNCPFCVRQSSIPEMRILSEFRYIFKNVESRKKIKNLEIDIFLPDYQIGFEYDGYFFHKDRYEKDLRKNILLKKEGIQLIRIREKLLKKISDFDIILDDREITKANINHSIICILQIISINDLSLSNKINQYIHEEDFMNKSNFNLLLSYFPSPLIEHSLENKFPLIAKQWHPTKNYPLLPVNFAYGSSHKVWWQCPISKDHEWEAAINDRTNKSKNSLKRNQGCPHCSGSKFTAERSFAKLSPEIAKQWHPTKNGDLTPEDFANKSNTKVWWQCPISKDHEWETAIGERTRTDGRASNCPYCSGHKFTYEKSLSQHSPEIAKQWHPTKNGILTPLDVSYGSDKKVWWQCPISKDHEWETVIRSRTRKKGTGCPFCYEQKRRS